MSRVIRPTVVGVVVAIFAIVLLPRSTALQGQGQASPPTPAQIAPFVGDWLVTLPFMATEATIAVAVKTDGGKVSATVSADGQPTVNVTDISVVANRLVLKYMTEAMGDASLDGPDADARRVRAPRQYGGHGRPVRDVRHGRETGPGRAGARERIRRGRAGFSDE